MGARQFLRRSIMDLADWFEDVTRLITLGHHANCYCPLRLLHGDPCRYERVPFVVGVDGRAL